jgi:hypothetical protein
MTDQAAFLVDGHRLTLLILGKDALRAEGDAQPTALAPVAKDANTPARPIARPRSSFLWGSDLTGPQCAWLLGKLSFGR